jgi:acyl dehydratase
MTNDGYTLATIRDHVGKEVGVTEWLLIDQARITAFADATDDHQWIHVDPERAARETPFGGTIAHGFLTLALCARFSFELSLIPKDAARAVNYGLDKVRFARPVRSGARVRDRITLLEATERAGGLLLKAKHSLEVEGERKPALVAEALVLVYGPDAETPASEA